MQRPAEAALILERGLNREGIGSVDNETWGDAAGLENFDIAHIEVPIQIVGLSLLHGHGKLLRVNYRFHRLPHVCTHLAKTDSHHYVIDHLLALTSPAMT